MRRSQKRRRPGGGGSRIVKKHGPLEFNPTVEAVNLVRTGIILAAWRRGRQGPQYYSVEYLPIALADPAIDFVLAPAEPLRLAVAQCKRLGGSREPMRLCDEQWQSVREEAPHDVMLAIGLGSKREAA